jgi:hypothetical protein
LTAWNRGAGTKRRLKRWLGNHHWQRRLQIAAVIANVD